MNQLENNIARSFRFAKSDIIKLQSDVIGLSQSQERLVEVLTDLKTRLKELGKRLKGNGNGKKHVFVASKAGKKFHIKECPYAKNIKPKFKLVFKTKTTALNKGFKPCRCVA